MPDQIPVPSGVLSQQQMRRGIDRLRKRIDEVYAFAPGQVCDAYNDPAVAKLTASIKETLSSVFGVNTPMYNNFYKAAEFSTGFTFINREPNFGEIAAIFESCKQRSLGLLATAVQALEEQLTGETDEAPGLAGRAEYPRKVFVVHGHDQGARETVARFLERIGFEPIILHEQANQGRTVIEKVEAHGDVGFAVVLLTPDDEGAVRGGASEPRARQNVLLELGYFIGRLGRGKVCALKRGVLEIPSDFAGVVWEAMDDAGGWKSALGRELQAAGHDIDWNKVMRP